MPIKDQCLRCRKYNNITDICSDSNQTPFYNSSSCQNYSTNRINLAKSEEVAGDNVVTPAPPQASANPTQPNNVQVPSSGWKRFFSFEGRIGRGEYLLSYLVYTIYSLPMNFMEDDDVNPLFALIWLLLLIPMVWMLIAQGAKRCHDLGNSGWFQLIPFYGIWMAFVGGDDGPNEYGTPV